MLSSFIEQPAGSMRNWSAFVSGSLGPSNHMNRVWILPSWYCTQGMIFTLGAVHAGEVERLDQPRGVDEVVLPGRRPWGGRDRAR